MPLNYKSIQKSSTAAQTIEVYECTVTSALVKSISIYNGSGGSADVTAKIQKSGESQRVLYQNKAIGNDTTIQILDEVVILENGDTIFIEFSASDIDSTTMLVENVSALSASDTSQLPQQSSGVEPWNRYMKNFDSLDTLTDSSSSNPEDVLSGSASTINFVVENNTLSPAPPQKVTFSNIIQALILQGFTDIADDPGNNFSLSTFTGSGGVGDLNDNGSVETADLLAFLVTFGSSWSNAANSLFQDSVVSFSDGVYTAINDTTWTTLPFDSGDYTVTAGTQNVTVDDTTNHDIKFESQASPYLLRDVPYKEIYVYAPPGQFALVTTSLANQRITVRLVVDLFNSSDGSLGAQGTFEISEASFGSSAAHPWINAPINVEITSQQIGDACSVADGLDNANFYYAVVSLQAKTNAGDGTIKLRKPKITLRQNYIPE
jgi:hypothetical protein